MTIPVAGHLSSSFVPTPGHLDSLCVPTWGFAIFFLSAYAQGLVRGEGGMGTVEIDWCINVLQIT